jgi:hypothetical protein
MARLYADENFDHGIVAELRALGHDVLTVQDAGQDNQGIGDPAVLAFAVADGRAVVTFNWTDFKRLHRHHRPHCGIILCTYDKDRAALALRFHQAVVKLPSLVNQLVRIYRPNTP